MPQSLTQPPAIFDETMDVTTEIWATEDTQLAAEELRNIFLELSTSTLL